MARRRKSAPPRSRNRLAALRALYDEIPAINCQGTCWDSCGPLPLLKLEQDHIRTTTGQVVPHVSEVRHRPYICPALTMLRLCSVHEVRPLICRLWGVVENLKCNFGCRPGRYLTVIEGYELLARAEELDGRPGQAAEIRASYATPELAEQFTALALARAERNHEDYVRRERDARAMGGTVFYVRGPGRVSSSKDRPDR